MTEKVFGQAIGFKWEIYDSMQNCVLLQFWKKSLANAKEIEQNWKRPESFEICYCVGFGCYFQGLERLSAGLCPPSTPSPLGQIGQLETWSIIRI